MNILDDNLIKCSDEQLREKCIIYALFSGDDNLTSTYERINLADVIYNYIKDGIIIDPYKKDK